MLTYLERYQKYTSPELSWAWQQEAKTIWAELISYRAAVRKEPLYTDARAVAHAMMERARHNIELLIARLNELEYHFAYLDRVWIPPDANTAQKLDELEHQFGLLPVVVRAWFEVVGTVNFMGAHPKLNSDASLEDDDAQLLDCAGDPLVVDGGVLERIQLTLYMTRSRYYNMYELSFAPDAMHKAGESGSGAISILMPNASFDAILIDPLHRWTGTFFVQHLQTSFAWGGFPGLQGGWYPEQQWDPAYSKLELEFLTKGLLPLL